MASAHDEAADARREPGDAPAARPDERATARPRVRRRATTPPPPGSDPAPLPEPERHSLDENDDRLKAEKPPHY